jgi:hypothetical protein
MFDSGEEVPADRGGSMCIDGLGDMWIEVDRNRRNGSLDMYLCVTHLCIAPLVEKQHMHSNVQSDACPVSVNTFQSCSGIRHTLAPLDSIRV